MPQKTTEKPEKLPMMQLINRSRYTIGLTSNPLDPKNPADGPRVLEALDPTSSRDIDGELWERLSKHEGTIKFIKKRWIVATPRVGDKRDKAKYDITGYDENEAIEMISMEESIEALQFMLENEKDLADPKHKERDPVRRTILRQLARVAQR